ncbi:hypothetical protein DSO57_1014130 [Entomophthora muscae]|uniref:Uncharacterized protein n=1 Tax=Entomophthora muscae TaxID=34485 RepID=A0ACC2RK99_9FUNG|nr:hypothetical protein DSO57_1014130 [Entomophthora muscae]
MKYSVVLVIVAQASASFFGRGFNPFFGGNVIQSGFMPQQGMDPNTPSSATAPSQSTDSDQASSTTNSQPTDPSQTPSTSSGGSAGVIVQQNVGSSGTGGNFISGV